MDREPVHESDFSSIGVLNLQKCHLMFRVALVPDEGNGKLPEVVRSLHTIPKPVVVRKTRFLPNSG